MTSPVLILRPHPGAEHTAKLARASGLSPILAPLFEIRPVVWTLTDPSRFDALLFTSANAARCAGDGLTSLLGLPCYAVGEATAEAAREAGLRDVRTGPRDSAALLEEMAAARVRFALHLCGREHRLPSRPVVAIHSVPVYAADSVDRLPEAAARAIEAKAIVLLHSPRAANLFSSWVADRRGDIAIAAISPSTVDAAGPGWAEAAVAREPRDQALLEAAAKLCHRGS